MILKKNWKQKRNNTFDYFSIEESKNYSKIVLERLKKTLLSNLNEIESHTEYRFDLFICFHLKQNFKHSALVIPAIN